MEEEHIVQLEKLILLEKELAEKSEEHILKCVMMKSRVEEESVIAAEEAMMREALKASLVEEKEAKIAKDEVIHQKYLAAIIRDKDDTSITLTEDVTQKVMERSLLEHRYEEYLVRNDGNKVERILERTSMEEQMSKSTEDEMIKGASRKSVIERECTEAIENELLFLAAMESIIQLETMNVLNKVVGISMDEETMIGASASAKGSTESEDEREKVANNDKSSTKPSSFVRQNGPTKFVKRLSNTLRNQKEDTTQDRTHRRAR